MNPNSPRTPKLLPAILLCVGTLAALSQRAEAQKASEPQQARPGDRASAGDRQQDFNSAIQNIVFIVKENRSLDSYFGTYPGAYGATQGTISTGQVIPLSHAGDRVPRDLNHTWDAAIQAIDYGRMDGFDLALVDPCSVNGDYLCYSQLWQQDLPNYWTYAQDFVLGDQMFASMTGPSYSQHIYTVAASSANDIGDLIEPLNAEPGCDAPAGAFVTVLSWTGDISNQYPCFDIPTLADSLNNAGLTWKNYGLPDSSWNGFLSINHIRNSAQWSTNVVEGSQFMADILHGQLPTVSWLIPNAVQSEHPINGTCEGENWTVEQINYIMNSSYWGQTAIFVVWDDHGGLYDHYPPPVLDEFGLGPRVPVLIISPYALAGHISHTPYEFSSVLKFIEERFNLPYLTNRDTIASDMLDSFDFLQSPLPPVVLKQRACPVLSQTSLVFNPQQVGKASSSRTILATNYNSFTLNFSSIATTGPFGQTNTCASGVPPPSHATGPQNCTVQVTLNPTTAGPQTGTLTLTDNDPTGSQVVQLSGTGSNIVLSPALSNFGTVVVGNSSATQTVTVSNTGSASVTINSITATPDYSLGDHCGGSLPAHGTCSVSVAFTPTTSGKRYAPLTVNSSDGGSPQFTNLTGIGTDLVFMPASLTFGNQALGTASTPQTVMLTNSGSTSLNISSITFIGTTGMTDGEYTVDFSQTNDCGSVVNAGATCTLSVVFNPTGLALRTATLNIYDPFGDSPQQVAVTGTGTASLDNAVAFVQPLVPASAAPGSASLNLAVYGTGFTSNAAVNWNGTALTTTNNGTHKLTATVPASLLAQPGTARVTVVNPSPGGGASNVDFFTVATPLGGALSLNRTDLTVGTTPQGVATGDFNGDGIQDLAIANSGSNSLSILLGNGNGTFTAQASPATGRQPVSLAVGDFNNDGKLDIAVGNLMDDTVEVLLGNGNGTFTPASSVASTVSPVSIAAGDFNGDGDLDVAVANDVEPEVSILLGNGDGTLTPTNTPTGEGSDPSAVVLGDFNGDGLLDAAEVNNMDLTLIALLGNGDGTFRTASGTPPATGHNPIAMSAGDFNGDGELDVAVANQADSTISVYLGKGDGLFEAGVTYATGAGPQAIATADVNNDGKLDLLTANATANTISVLLGSGTGTFASHTDYAIGTKPTGLAVADFNGDGRLDVAATNSGAGTISVMLQTASSGPAVQFSPASLTFATQLVKTSSPAQVVTLTNVGNATLTISGISVTGNDPSDFPETNTCGSSLNAGASCTISVTFKPSMAGLRSASISVSDNAAGSPQMVPLSGTGTVMEFVPSSLNFGTVKVGNSSTAQTLTVTNVGTTAVKISQVSKGGADPQDFLVNSDTCLGTLAGGASCAVTLTFKPTATGLRTATLEFFDKGGGSPQMVPLSGTGD